MKFIKKSTIKILIIKGKNKKLVFFKILLKKINSSLSNFYKKLFNKELSTLSKGMIDVGCVS